MDKTDIIDPGRGGVSADPETAEVSAHPGTGVLAKTGMDTDPGQVVLADPGTDKLLAETPIEGTAEKTPNAGTVPTRTPNTETMIVPTRIPDAETGIALVDSVLSVTPDTGSPRSELVQSGDSWALGGEAREVAHEHTY